MTLLFWDLCSPCRHALRYVVNAAKAAKVDKDQQLVYISVCPSFPATSTLPSYVLGVLIARQLPLTPVDGCQSSLYDFLST